MASDSSQDDLDLAFQKPERSRVSMVIGAAAALVIGATAVLYTQVERRGVSLKGPGHITVLADGATWVFFLNGAQAQATPESASAAGAQSGPCAYIGGSFREGEPVFIIDQLDCSPGQSVVPRITERMGLLGLQFGYWELESDGQSLADAALTSEVMGAMIDPRAEAPQLVPLYSVLFPETLAAARGAGSPPLIIHVDRNDLVTNRLGRDQLSAFLARDRFVLAGAGAKGGWLIRTVLVREDGLPTLEQLLVNPNAAPWTSALHHTTVPVQRKGPGRPVGAVQSAEEASKPATLRGKSEGSP